MKSTKINGPINVARLEGDINGIHKTLYTFMDIHMELGHQTKCNDPFADEFHQYLMRTVYQNKDISYDFFLEIHPEDIIENLSTKKEKYILDLRKFFKQEFQFDFQKDKVLKSKTCPNLRFHYIDIRESMDYMLTHFIFELSNYIDGIMKTQDFTMGDYYFISEQIKNIYEKIAFLESVIFPNGQNGGKHIFTSKTSSTDINNTIKSFIKKIREMYVHIDTKNMMNDIFNKIMENDFETLSITFPPIQTILEEFYGLLHTPQNKKLMDNYITYGIPQDEMIQKCIELKKIYDNIFNKIIVLYVHIMDFFFMRRFLDKNYIQHGITYTGLMHSCTYLHILVRYFNFKVTHVAYCDEKDITKLNEYISNKDNNMGAPFEFMFWPNKFIQCSNLKDFPNKLT